MLSCQNRSLCLITRARPLIKTPHPDRLLLESHLHTFLLVKYNNEHMIIKRRAKAICWELYVLKLQQEGKQIRMETKNIFKPKHRWDRLPE